MDGSFLLLDATLGVGWAGLDVLRDDVHILHDDTVFLADDLHDRAGLAFVAARDHLHGVALLDFNALVHNPGVQSTSGAETIFMKSFS